jgi:uncharacterized repeat protein (TIGR01451 family)
MFRPVLPSVAAAAAIGLIFGSVLVSATPAQAASATVTLTPSATTVESNVTVTYTLSIVCSGPSICEDTVVTFPTDAITGNGANDDIGSWFGDSSCGFVTRTVGSGLVTYDYGDLETGNQQCTFTVRAPEYTTLGGAVVTLTPTVSGSTIATVSGTPATLTIVAGHNASLAKSAPTRVLPGAEFNYTVRFVCGENSEYTGDIGMSAIRIEDPLPANFTYSGYTTRNGVPGSVTITEPAVGSTGGTFVYNDTTGATCGNPPLNISNAMEIYVRGSIDGPVGTQACNTATAEFTYIDGETGSDASGQACPEVAEIDTISAKGASSTSMGNAGQHPGGAYTYPGDWDQSGAPVTFTLASRTNPAANDAGIAYLMRDPLPCLDNLVDGAYLSNTIGTLCEHPAFIPVRITATGFTPTAADEIVLHYADGTTESVAFAGGGWDIPTPTPGGGVAELEIPPFDGEGANAGQIAFEVSGLAADDAQPGNVLRNTSSTESYVIGQEDPIGPAEQATANIYIADPDESDGDGTTTIYPSLSNSYLGSCVARVRWSHPGLSSLQNNLEITAAPSESMYFDYLAPVGATMTTGMSRTFQFLGNHNGQSVTSEAIAAVVTPDYNGTGRTLYSWTVPAGLITVPGYYRMVSPAMDVDLGPGCAGTYDNDMTFGYGTQVQTCLYNNYSSAHVENPPMLPKENDDLTTNGSPIAGNFCGYSAPLQVAAINPGYALDKIVQGNLDPAPAAPGTNGRVSPEGGEATYTVEFRNTGESNLTDPVMYDLLPAIGDTIASGATARNSDFAVELTDMGTLPTGLTVEYSTATNPCRPEVLATNPGCTGDWSTTPPGDLGDTTALRFQYDGTVFVSGGGGINGFEVEYTVSTPPADNGDVAWNSVGSNVLAGNDLMGAAESTLVGLEAADAPLAVTKSSSVPTFDAAGQTITFTYTVTNDTAVPLTGVTVTDAFTDADPGSTAPTASCLSLSSPDAACSGASTSLQPGQVATFTATYTTTQGDVDHGLIVDQATSSGLPPSGGALEGTSNAVTVTAVQDPALTLGKTATPTTVSAAGTTVGYEFLVTNTGNVTLSSIDIDELTFTGSDGAPVITCPAGDLAPTDDVTCTATYTVTQDDMDAGSIENTATATGDLNGETVTSPSSSATVTVLQDPSLDLQKTATPGQVGSAGQAVTYSFLITNDGNVTIDAITVSETAFTGTGVLGPVDCPTTSLAPGNDVTCTAAYTVTQDDIDAAGIENTAQATGTDPAGTAIPEPPTSDFTVEVVLAPAITLVKTADVTHVTQPGAVISYDFQVINNGNTTLTGVHVDELTFTGTGTMGTVDCPTTTLAPTQQTVCTASYTTVQDDSRLSTIINTAQAVATSGAGGVPVTVTSTSSTATVTAAIPRDAGLANTGSALPALSAALVSLLAIIGGVLLSVGYQRRGRARSRRN